MEICERSGDRGIASGYELRVLKWPGFNMNSIKFLAPRDSVLSRREELISQLKTMLPRGSLVHELRELVPFETDAFISYKQMPLAVVLPENTAQVAATMSFCYRNSIPVVPRGAGTSLCGGAIPQPDAIVVGLSKMNVVLDVDYENRAAVVQAGVTNLRISEHVGADGFFYAPDPSSQLACTIGGTLA